MKTLDEIYAVLDPIAQKLERHRTELLVQSKRGLKLLFVPISGFIICLIVMLIYPKYATYLFAAMAACAFGLARVYFKHYQGPIDLYKHKFKSKLLEKMIESLYPNLDYSPDKEVAEAKFYASGLFHGKANEGYDGEDHFKGVIKGIPVEFSEITADRILGKNSTRLFHGLFLVADLERSFKGRTFVLPDDAESWFGSDMDAEFKKEVERLDCTDLPYLKDNDVFNNEFVIYTTNEAEAKHILCEDVLKSILLLRQQFNSDISISFQNYQDTGWFFLAIHMGNSKIFEPNIEESLTQDHHVLKGMCAELITYLDIIESIPLKIEEK